MSGIHRGMLVLLLVALASTAAVFALPFDGVLIEDFNQFPHLWQSSPAVKLTNMVIAQGSPLALPGQGPTEGVLNVTAPLRIPVQVQGRLCNSGHGVATDVGGVYAFFDASVLIENSTISGNNVGDVGGGIRMLGDATLRNSTLSGNIAAGWYGSAVFHTDGVMTLVHTTVTGNLAPDYAGAALFVGTGAVSTKRSARRHPAAGIWM